MTNHCNRLEQERFSWKNEQVAPIISKIIISIEDVLDANKSLISKIDEICLLLDQPFLMSERHYSLPQEPLGQLR